MSDSRIDGPLPPQEEPVSTFRTLVPYVGKPCNLTILSERIVSVITHWLPPRDCPPAGRDVLHRDDDCPKCHQGYRKRWKGYLMAWDHNEGGYRLATFSFDGAALLLKMFPPPTSLRGQSVDMIRLGKSNQNPIWWQHSSRPPLRPLPPAPDPVPSLVRMYGPDVVKEMARYREEQESLGR